MPLLWILNFENESLHCYWSFIPHRVTIFVSFTDEMKWSNSYMLANSHPSCYCISWWKTFYDDVLLKITESLLLNPIRDILAAPLKLPQAISMATQKEELEIISAMCTGTADTRCMLLYSIHFRMDWSEKFLNWNTYRL